MKPKVLIIIMVVMVVLFAICLCGSVTGFPGSRIQLMDVANAPGPQTIVARLKPELTTADIVSVTPTSCRQLSDPKVFQLGVGGTCTVTIKGSSALVRTLALTLTQGTETDVTLKQEERYDATATLRAGDPPKRFDIYQKGGTLTLQCNSVAPCRVATSLK